MFCFIAVFPFRQARVELFVPDFRIYTKNRTNRSKTVGQNCSDSVMFSSVSHNKLLNFHIYHQKQNPPVHGRIYYTVKLSAKIEPVLRTVRQIEHIRKIIRNRKFAYRTVIIICGNFCAVNAVNINRFTD